jgi:pimeloyl-ACP methyl ester carboxylesterase
MHSSIVVVATLLAVPLASRCEERQPVLDEDGRAVAAKAVVDNQGAIRMEELPGTAPPMFVMRGRSEGATPIVFLHGMCGHALGYAQAFQFSAARKGVLVAPQGDHQCDGSPFSSWTSDVESLDERLRRTFEALGVPQPLRDATVIGYSQGASRAEALARKYPERYSHLVLMAGPTAPSVRALRSLRAVVTMAGERDRRDLMRAGAEAFRAVGVPATFQVIPEARHGEMGPHPEQTMGAALDWLWENEKPEAPAN